MSVQTQIDRISGAVSAALTALSEKGVTVPAGTKVDGLAALIAAIEAGGSGGGGGASVETCDVTLCDNSGGYIAVHATCYTSDMGFFYGIESAFETPRTLHNVVRGSTLFVAWADLTSRSLQTNNMKALERMGEGTVVAFSLDKNAESASITAYADELPM